MSKPLTTAKYRKMAWDAREKGDWKAAAKYYKLALKHYPTHHAKSQTAIADKAALQRLLDEVQWEAQFTTPKSKEKNGINSITNNLPEGYVIRKWRHEDKYGHKLTSYAVYLRGTPVFPQNKTFSTLTAARKAVKEHADTERLRKQIQEERAYFEKYGNLGKTGYIR